MKNAEQGYYMVRAMRQTEQDFDLFFEKNVVAVGWSYVDFTSSEDAEALVERVYYSDGKTAPQVVGKKKNEVRRFKGIKSGDRIIIPYYDAICLAKARSEQLYDKTIVDSLDLSNQRQVDYLRVEGSVVHISRDELSERLQRRLRVRGTTVADLYEFGEEIEALFSKKNFSWLLQFEKAQKDLVSDFKTELLQNIQEGKTNLQTGGVGLENLVRELLEIEGYKAKVLSKSVFPGFADADIRASRADRFGEINLLVQVKHHTGITDTWGAKQLAEILRQQPTKYPDYKLVLVSTAEASDELREMCEKQDIILFTGSDLASWVFEAIPKLDPKTRIKLGISNVPELAV